MGKKKRDRTSKRKNARSNMAEKFGGKGKKRGNFDNNNRNEKGLKTRRGQGEQETT